MKRKPNKPTDGRAASGKKAALRVPSAGAEASLTPGQKWRYRILALIIIPLLFLGGAEGMLRLCGYGYDTGFFQKVLAGGKEYLAYNENFTRRFFPPQLERSPNPVMIEAKKPANTYRIFILGESAARGDPEMPFAASRYLEKLLEERHPETKFEVVNLGMTAINSHVILPIARDAARAGGDLWIIYMGNNEMVGPFGAATVFGVKAPPLGFVRLSVAIQKTRIGQWLADVGRRLKGKGANASWRGMQMFVGNEVAANDPRKEAVYENFERNLSDIIRVGLDSGAKILLNTVAVNLKDCPPFASLANSNLPPADRTRFDQLYQEGSVAELRRDYAGASQKFAEAAKLDPQYAELQYRWGECSMALADFAKAREEFDKARDLDALPFRTDSRLNGTIEKAGHQYGGENLVFFDAASALAGEVPGGICGQETFYEHVHFNFDGNYRLGRAWADQVEKMLPEQITRAGAGTEWSTREVCERRLGLTDWGRFAKTKLAMDNLRRPPLSSQPNNTERLLALAADMKQWRAAMTATAARDATAVFEEAIQHSPQDYFLVENDADFLEATGNLQEAVAQWRRACKMLPTDCTAYYQTGRLLSALNQLPEAEEALTKAIALRPRLAEAWGVCGNVFLASGRYEAALSEYERAAELDPDGASYCAYIGTALSKLNRHNEAIKRYRQALQMQPSLWEVHLALGDEYDGINHIDDSRNEYAEAVKLTPNNALAHLKLGVMEVKLGHFDAAREEFDETLRLEPGNQTATAYIGRLQELRNRVR